MDAKPLPTHPSLEQYEKQAKDLLKACTSANPDAIHAWAAQWIGSWAAEWMDTQARLEGVPVTPEMRARLDREADRIARGIQSKLAKPDVTLAGAQLFIARGHGFGSWPKLAKHIEEVARNNSEASRFEAAADAIVGGDVAALERLLREERELIRARSNREHRSTLLHYVSANGVEDFRQKTPGNAVEVARLLLEAGADVNAESDAYRGRSTTLALTATSFHPWRAGIQNALLQLLLDNGARIDGPGSTVLACLANGRAEAAEYLAAHGAQLDLELAAGVGRLDVVKTFFREDGTLKPSATSDQRKDGFAWACEHGRTDVVEFLLERGIDVTARLKQDGQTALHCAAYGGHADLVKLFLELKAPVEVKEERYQGTPLEWALYGWGHPPERAKRDRYYEVVALLVGAGAKLDQEWFAFDPDRPQVVRLRTDPRMAAALRGEMPR